MDHSLPTAAEMGEHAQDASELLKALANPDPAAAQPPELATA